jgi:DNA-binding MurR/RpiR family transcriptional regulator
MEVICSRIEEMFSSLSPMLQQAARFVMDNPEEVALNSMRGVAAKAEVHPTSMLRLARVLGFDSYEDFRDRYRDWVLSRGSMWSGRARTLRDRRPQSAPETLIHEIIDQEQQNLHISFSDENVAKLLDAKELIDKARDIYVLGLRSLYPVAFYFNYVCRMFMSNTVLMSGVGGTFADELRSIDHNDALIAFSYRPYARDTVRAVEFARARKAKLISVTDSKLSPIGKDAHISIVVSNTTSSLIQTIIPSLAVAQALAALLLSESGPESMRALGRSELQLHSFNVYFEERREREKKGR